jgi:hypothetical protein
MAEVFWEGNPVKLGSLGSGTLFRTALYFRQYIDPGLARRPENHAIKGLSRNHFLNRAVWARCCSVLLCRAGKVRDSCGTDCP